MQGLSSKEDGESAMIEIKNKNGKKLKKEIEMLKVKFRDVELRPCHGDEDLRQKDSDLATLR